MFFKSDTVFDDDVTLKALASSSTVNENLNGGQIQTILNGFLYRSMQTVIEHTKLFDDFVAYLVYYMVKVKKRRITYVDRTIALNRLIVYLFTDQTDYKFKLLKSLGIERYYLYRYLMYSTNCLNVCNIALKETLSATTQQKFNLVSRQLSILAKQIDIKTTDIHNTCENLAFYLDCYIKYRQKVISHYYKLCHKKARKQYKEKNNSSYDINEIYQNYLLAVAKAIDKYDARRGAMTSYINWWILNVSTCDYSNYEYGIAYQIPSSYRRDMANHKVNQTNFSISLESLVSSSADSSTQLKDTLIAENSDHAVKYEEDDSVTRFRRLIKAVDPTGIARIQLGIEEIFSSQEINTMRRHMDFLKRKFTEFVHKQQNFAVKNL